ncbi:hypothetical protein N7508_008393 [Penicillium antarcticum]|uniref:uncharacterized protein n=1 Tax=Penicillium antarcticum TaxID=416450 RepID=UPI0023821D6A|nr:uncharacterized protein N7508_008393 [Penicillium antarcticum]KAJ5293572.1 hypothetical protein N7508_008393 [Penicillium antarcticum]
MAKDRAFCGPLNSDDNPIPTNDEDSEQEGSETNPIVINDDADALDKEERPVQNDFTRDTEPLSTPEFWAILRNLGDQGFHVPQNKPKITDLACGLPSSQSVYDQMSDCTCSPEPESFPTTIWRKKDPKLPTPPNKDESCGLIAETNTSCGQPSFSWSGQGDELGPSTETSQADNGNPLRLQGSGKRKRGHEGENNSGNRRSNRLANRGKQDRNSSFLSF